MKFADPWKNKNKHQVNDRINKKPTDQKWFQAFGFWGLILHERIIELKMIVKKSTKRKCFFVFFRYMFETKSLTVNNRNKSK